MRISDSCVSAEDVKLECGADSLIGYMQIGFGIMIVKERKFKKPEWIGYIDYHCEYLGDDLLISKVVIYEDEKESRRLTDLFKGKILITSKRDNIT
ncbi:hypothetical protein [Cytobacillus gottheilii]|uniref:hypothetical protein n=1 Tax=Cytobacillus gottheilii TaxID=859144 RepID=UPI0009BA2EF3|nr:hypothetical protein [Cytobacillus gottheilii]